MSTTQTQTEGRSWLEMRPAHFDTTLLPRRHRRPEPEGLFSVADIAPPPAPKPTAAPELDGQGELFE
jgi:hypothetical protein